MSDQDSSSSTISIKPDPGSAGPYRRGNRNEPPRQSHFNGLLVFVIALMAVVMGIGGYALYEANQLLIAGQKNIEDLDARLAATGTDVSKTLQTMQAGIKDLTDGLKANEHEIRKLWDVSNKRNRNWIKNNEKEITKASVLIAEVASELGTLEAAASDAVSEVDDLRTKVLLTEGQIQDQVDHLIATQRELSILEKQMKEVDEAIQAIDLHRIQVNQEIRFLKEGLRSQGVSVQEEGG